MAEFDDVLFKCIACKYFAAVYVLQKMHFYCINKTIVSIVESGCEISIRQLRISFLKELPFNSHIITMFVM